MTTLTLRDVKGSPLTNAEVDGNFTNLNSEKSFFVASSTAPTSPAPQAGDLWYDTGDGILFLYFDDGTSSEVPVWIDITGQGTLGSSETLAFPNSPSNGDTQTFFEITFTYNSTKGAWVRTSGGSGVTAETLIPYLYRKLDGAASDGEPEFTIEGGTSSSTYEELAVLDGGLSSG